MTTTQRVSDGTFKRLTSGPFQFFIAIGACFALVGVIWLMTPRANKEMLPHADVTEGATALRLSAPYVSYVPQGLPALWRPTSSRLTGTQGKGPVSWHVGYVTPKDQYAALEQSNERPASAFVTRMTNVDPANVRNLAGTVQVAGATWNEYYRKDKHQYSLVRQLPDVTLVATGTASYEELAVLAGSLQPQQGHKA